MLPGGCRQASTLIPNHGSCVRTRSIRLERDRVWLVTSRLATQDTAKSRFCHPRSPNGYPKSASRRSQSNNSPMAHLLLYDFRDLIGPASLLSPPPSASASFAREYGAVTVFPLRSESKWRALRSPIATVWTGVVAFEILIGRVPT